MSECKNKGYDCGLCKDPDYNACWHDICKECGEIRIEHRYGFTKCGKLTIGDHFGDEQ